MAERHYAAKVILFFMVPFFACINKVHSLTSLLVFAISTQGFDPKTASLEMVAGVCATQANFGAVPPAPEKAGWHEQTGVGEEDEEDLEELPPEAFMDSDKSTDEDFLDDPDFYSLLDKQGSFQDVRGGSDSTVGTPSQHEAAELTLEGGMQQAETRKERDMRVLNRGLFLLHKAAKLQAAGLARIQAICRSSPDIGMLLRAFSSVHVPDLTAGALTPQVPMLAPLSKHPQIQGEQMKPVPVGVVDGARVYKCPSCTVLPPGHGRPSMLTSERST